MLRFFQRRFPELSRTEEALFFSLLLFLFAQFFIPSDEIYRWVALLGFLPIGLYALARQHAHGLSKISSNRIFVPLALFLGYAFIQSIYVHLSAHVTAKPLLHCFLIAVFLFSVILVFMHINAQRLAIFQTTLLSYCLVSGLIALSIFAYQRALHPHLRLSGLGANNNSNLGGFVFAQCGLLAIGLYLTEMQHNLSARRKIFLIGTFVVIIAFIAATQSKGVVFSFAVSTIILLALYRYKKTALALTIGTLLLSGFLFFVFVQPIPEMVEFFRALPFGDELYTRGGSYRLGIWHRAIELIQAQPVLGYGLGSRFPYKYTHPHNLALSVSYYLGLAGLALYLLVVLKTLVISKMRPLDAAEKIYYAQFCLMLLGSIADFCEPIHGVSVMWFILWLPFAVFHGLRTRRFAAEATQ